MSVPWHCELTYSSFDSLLHSQYGDARRDIMWRQRNLPKYIRRKFLEFVIMAYKFVFGLQSRRDKIFHCEQSIDETVRWSLRERVYQNRIIFVDFGFLIFLFLSILSYRDYYWRRPNLLWFSHSQLNTNYISIWLPTSTTHHQLFKMN